MKPDDIHDLAYREVRILSQLQMLEVRTHSPFSCAPHFQKEMKCGNFIVLRNFVKSHPPFLFEDDDIDYRHVVL